MANNTFEPICDNTNNTTPTTLDSDSSSSSQLQPRKRAKTSEEKEQRRMERILRNRRAAHKSRERKRFYLNLYQEKSEKYDLLFKKLMESDILNSNPILTTDSDFTKLKEELLELNKKQDKFERENGTVNSSVPKKDKTTKNSDEEDEDDEEHDDESEDKNTTTTTSKKADDDKKQLKSAANDLLFLNEEQPSSKKRKLNSRKDSSSTVFSSSSTTPNSVSTLPKLEESEEFGYEHNFSTTFLSPSNSITTIKNSDEENVVTAANQNPVNTINNNKINPLDLSLELGIDMEEPDYNLDITNNILLNTEVDDLLIMQRYPAVITF